MTVQLDLFGDVEAAEHAARVEADHTAQRDAAFDDLVQTATATAAEAEAAGIFNVDTQITVFICPACGGWEPNEMLMGISHGISRDYLVQLDTGEWANGGMYFGRLWCEALELTANHATYGDGHLYTRQHTMIERLRPEVRARYEQEVATRPRRHPEPPRTRSARHTNTTGKAR